jgi:hypothetical protein
MNFRGTIKPSSMRVILLTLLTAVACCFSFCGTDPKTSTAAASIQIDSPSPAAISCADLLTTEMVETTCGMKGIVERVTSIEQAGKNCNRSYRLGKGWGDDMIFIATQTPGKADLSYIKKAYADKGIEAVKGIGEEAYTMNFTDKLTGRQEHQLVFVKKNLFIEIKTKESASAKTPCPCYDLENLKKLGTAIAAKIN